MQFVIVGAFIILDMVTGIIKALKEKCFDSSVMREGLFHKSAEVGCIAFGVLVDNAQNYFDLGVSVPMTLTMCGYVILMEIGSITENLHGINNQLLPDKLKSYFKKLT